MARVVVERQFSPALTMSDIAAMERESHWCMDTYRIKRLESFFANDGEHLICVYEAPDVESVRRANETAGLPYTRSWAAEELP